jgi:hypothetical protein
MKSLLVGVLSVGTFITLGGRAAADTVALDVLSQTYSISADLMVDQNPPPPSGPFFTVSGSSSSSIYLSDLLSPSDPPLVLSPDALQTRATGQVSGSTASLEAVQWAYFATCSSDITFHPSAAALLTITCNGSRNSDSFFTVQLKDVTTGSILLTRDTSDYEKGFPHPGWTPIPWQGPYEFSVDPTHVYELLATAAGAADVADASANISLASAADAGSTWVLLAMGLTGLAGLRWRRAAFA